jgi:hypothetical protein
MQAQTAPRFDRSQIAAFVAVAILSGSLGVGIGVLAEDSGGSQTFGSTTREDISSGGRSESALDAESARYAGQARLYDQREGFDLRRGRRAYSARLEAAADFYRSAG